MDTVLALLRSGVIMRSRKDLFKLRRFGNLRVASALELGNEKL